MEKYTVRNLNFSYPDQSEKALNNINLSIKKGSFVVVCGPSGCGKSTLLRHLKTVLAPHGEKSGDILFDGISLDEVDSSRQAAEIGFVAQSPDDQIVTDKVWHELAFGLESLGTDTASIRARVAEMASFFGIQNWFYKKVTELSGGQKQLLNLASVMVMNPGVIILDEPTSQLDPIAASDFLAVLSKINHELGITVILTEHRLEEALPLAAEAVIMDKGKIFCTGTVREVGKKLKEIGSGMFLAMPAAMRIWSSVKSDEECPLTVCDGSIFLSRYAEKNQLYNVPEKDTPNNLGEAVLEAEDVWFRYEKNSSDIIKRLNITLHKGELLAVLGGNGIGKTTSLKVLAGLRKHYRGEIRRKGKIGFLPQDPQALFVKKTVLEDMIEVIKYIRISDLEKEKMIMQTAGICRIEHLLERHPYDLSGGEQQRAALAKILLCDPEILFLDEPTKGLDAKFKEVFSEILNNLLSAGKSVLMVSHDIEFCAEHAHRCALFFDGEITSSGSPREFFSGNSFYTTSASRMSRHIVSGAVTVNDVISVIGGDVKDEISEKEKIITQNRKIGISDMISGNKNKLPAWRKIIAVISGLSAIVMFFYSAAVTDLTEIITANGLSKMSKDQIFIYLILIISLLIMSVSIGGRSEKPLKVRQNKEKRKLAKRTVLSVAIVVIAIPLTLLIGIIHLEHKNYNIISLLVLTECMLPFFMVFEGKRPKSRELVVIAALCAIGVAGRAAFFMLPQFKPVMAVTIIAGVAFGGETGFLVGAVTMLVSNMMFAQGPWTPWQMFAMGLTGFLAGVLFRKGILKRTKTFLSAYGAVAAILIYGGIMNPASSLIWSTETINGSVILAYYISGFPMDCVHAFATAFFLYFASQPMIEKLDRIKLKYGIID